MDQIQSKADQATNTARNMAANNVPGSLKPTGEIPGSTPVDKAGVPLSLQGQISPLRAQEITDPSRKPLSERPRPSLADSAFLPPPQQNFQAAAGKRDGIVAPATQQGQPMPSPSEANKTWKKKEPERNFWDNPLKYKGIEVIPSVTPDGGKVEVRVPWDNLFKNK